MVFSFLNLFFSENKNIFGARSPISSDDDVGQEDV